MSLERHPGGGEGVGGGQSHRPRILMRDNEEEDDDREEVEVTPPPHSLPREALPSLGDIFSR
jgi:hypothetical protein